MSLDEEAKEIFKEEINNDDLWTISAWIEKTPLGYEEKEDAQEQEYQNP